VQSAIRGGADLNQVNGSGDTALLYIAKEGHYKYPPAEIPALLVQSGADLEAKNKAGYTALQVRFAACCNMCGR
jgi:ankyrin repeat protein